MSQAPDQRSVSQEARNTNGIGGGVSARHVTARVRVGEMVEVRGKAEILATLDERGRLDGMPFMPEMFQYCGQPFPVYKRAHKTCDTVSGNSRGLTLEDSVHLDLRCAGKAHGGCQAGCLLFWKEAWLGDPSPRHLPRHRLPPRRQRPARPLGSDPRAPNRLSRGP
jgi:hypothetical protein